jgi:hypothetical protein
MARLTIAHQDLEILKPCIPAVHNFIARGETGCRVGTREGVIGRIVDWTATKGPEARMLWLNGPAGVGKTAIAKTVAERLSKQNKLAATFFFSRNTPGCNDAGRVITTLAWQLAMSIPETKKHIVKALADDSSLPSKSIREQFNHLIAEPLRKTAETATSSRITMIIDGVDECSDEEMQGQLLRVMKDATRSENGVPLNILISSRPERLIRNTLTPLTPGARRKTLFTPKTQQKSARRPTLLLVLDLLSLESGFASGFALVAYYLKSDIPLGSVLGVALGITLGLSSGRALGLPSGASSGGLRCIPACILLALWGYPLGGLSALLLGALLNVPSGTPFPPVVPFLSGVLLGLPSGVASGILLGDMSGVMSLSILSGVLSALLLAFPWSVLLALPRTLLSALLVSLLGVGLLVPLLRGRPSFTVARNPLSHPRKWVREIQASYRHFHSISLPGGNPAPCDNVTILDRVVLLGGISCLTIGRSDESEKDIRNYFEQRLTEILTERDLDRHSWLSDEKLDELARISCGQFIYASTALGFIDNSDCPRSSVEIILRHRPAVSSPYPELDSLYTEILQRQPETDKMFLTDLLALLVMFSDHPLFVDVDEIHDNIPLITTMLNLGEGVVAKKLRGMHSLLEVSANSVRVHHVSFLEFLERGCSQDYCMPPRRANRIFLKLCVIAIIRIYWGMIWYAMIFHFGPYSNSMFVGPTSTTRPARETFMT